MEALPAQIQKAGKFWPIFHAAKAQTPAMKLDPGAVDHDFVAAWIEHMKSVYQRALDSYAQSNQITGGELQKVRNHLRALAMIQKTVAEHHEMAQGHTYDAGDITLGMRTVATLIKPNGEVIAISRKEKSDG